MGALASILQKARQRAQDENLPYSGALTPAEASQILELTPSAKLVDVRSHAELDLVGRIPQAISIEWAFYPGWVANPDFRNQLAMQLDKEALVMFICRSGARSHHAATLASSLGFTEAYNVLEGFEGETAAGSKQRGKVNGWKVAGLAWING